MCVRNRLPHPPLAVVPVEPQFQHDEEDDGHGQEDQGDERPEAAVGGGDKGEEVACEGRDASASDQEDQEIFGERHQKDHASARRHGREELRQFHFQKDSPFRRAQVAGADGVLAAHEGVARGQGAQHVRIADHGQDQDHPWRGVGQADLDEDEVQAHGKGHGRNQGRKQEQAFEQVLAGKSPKRQHLRGQDGHGQGHGHGRQGIAQGTGQRRQEWFWACREETESVKSQLRPELRKAPARSPGLQDQHDDRQQEEERQNDDGRRVFHSLRLQPSR